MAAPQATDQTPPRARKDLELFWRIVAGLMLMVIGWAAWVAYQITPRSLVTPLAYAGPKAAAPATTRGSQGAEQPAIPPADEAVAPLGAKEGAQAAAGLGAQKAEPAATAGAIAHKPASQAMQDDGLKMATKISTLPGEKAENPSLSDNNTTGSVTAAATGPASAKP